jgi:hypothetical protein
VSDGDGGLSSLVRSAYSTLGLQTYFTTGEKETRAWTIRKGMTAPQAAGGPRALLPAALGAALGGCWADEQRRWPGRQPCVLGPAAWASADPAGAPLAR